MVTIQLLNVTSTIHGLNNVQEATLDSALSYWSDGFYFSPKYRSGGWDGRIHLFKKSTYANPFGKFPTGLLSRILGVLDNTGVPVQIEDKRVRPPMQTPLELKGFELRDYQLEAVNLAVERGRGLFRLPTASGKTPTFSGIIARLNVPTLVLSHRTEILLQIKSTMETMLGQEIGHIQGSSKDLKKFNVGMVQTIFSAFEKHDVDQDANRLVEWVKNDCLCIVGDEIHHAQSKQFTHIMNRAFNCYHRYGFSATIDFGKAKDLSVEAGFGKVQMSLTPSDMIRQKRLSRPYIFFVDYGDLSSDNSKVTICNDCGCTYLREVTRKIGRKKKDEDEDVLDLTRTTYICNQCGREWSNYSSAVARNLVENERRNDAIAKLVAGRMRKRMSVLVLVNYIEHGKIIHEKLSKLVDPNLIEFVWSGTDYRKELLQQLKRKEKLCLIGTQVYSEGIDIPSLSCVVYARASNSDIDTLQSVGRALRRDKGKWRTIILDFKDGSKYFAKRSAFRKKLLEAEPEFRVFDYKLWINIK